MYLVRASDDFHTHRLTRHASRWDLTCAPALLCDCLMRDIHLAIIDPPSPSVPALPSMPALWQAGIPPQDPRAGSRQSAYLDVSSRWSNCGVCTTPPISRRRTALEEPKLRETREATWPIVRKPYHKLCSIVGRRQLRATLAAKHTVRPDSSSCALGNNKMPYLPAPTNKSASRA